MDAPTDPAKLRAALEHLEAVQAQRLAEKIAAGEIVSVPLFIVAGSEAEAARQVEEAKTAKLAELHAGGDQREVVFAVNVVRTGVVRHDEVADPASVPTAPSFLSSEDRAIRPKVPLPPSRSSSVAAPRNEEEAVREPQPPVIETYVQVQVRQCADDDDPGEIAEGWFSVDGKVLTVTNANGKYVGSRALLKGEDARVVAKALLREKSPKAESFNRRLSYPSAGLA